MVQTTETLAAAVAARASNLYSSRRMLCAEAVLTALNEELDGGLNQDQAVGLASGFSFGLGGSGCLCGAAGGSILAIGLLLGSRKAWESRKEIRETAKAFQQWFKTEHGSTCCRVLSKQAGGDSRLHFAQCRQRTAASAHKAAHLILERRPNLAATAAPVSRPGQATRLGSLLLHARSLFRR
jgi:C_GCAxxG_C_C family probable redox protein